MKMRLLVVAVVVAAAAAKPRVRRQLDGCFWWEQDCNTDAGSASTTTTTPSTSPPNAPDLRDNSEATRIVNVEQSNYPSCNRGRGVCVPYYLCKEGNVVTDGAGLLDIRFGGSNNTVRSSSDCSNYLDVCCNNPENTHTTVAPHVAKCGVRNEQGFDIRILGFQDNQAQFAEFPWMAAILRVESVGQKQVNLYVCGGSLIHPQIVMTAAHCVHGKAPNSLKVRLGEWDTQREYEPYGHQDRNVVQVTIHEQYNSGALYNDVALLFLDTPAELAPNVDTVCLPQYGQNFDGYRCFATGWGRDEFGKEGEFQNVLKKVNLPVVDNFNCQNALRTTRLGNFFQLDPSFMCAGGEPGLDTCKGDGGSPLVCEASRGSYVQVGIVAWGIGCGEGGVPGVYASVPYNTRWIVENADRGLANLAIGTGYDWGLV